jgi:hypothetical protein
MEITSIKVLTSDHGPDYCYLHTSLPNPCWPYEGNLAISFPAAAGTGVDYCAKHFPNIPIEIIRR